MSLLALALINLRGRPARSLLTIAAIALGIAAIVSLTSIAWGFEASWQKANDSRGTDLVVTRVASENSMPSPFPAEPGRAGLAALPHVQDVVGLLSEMLSVSDDGPPVFVFGWAHGSYLWGHLHLVDGRWPADDQQPVVVIGTIAAELLHKKPGDSLAIEGQPFRVIGVFESPAMVENGAVVMTLSQAQRVTDKPGKVNVLNIKMDPAATDVDTARIRQRVKASMPGFVAITSGELVRQNAIVRIAKAMSQATALIAGLVGALMVFNTMLMSVNERTREIGLLQALGWERYSVIALIVLEAALLAFAGGLIGIIAGAGLASLLEHLDLMRGKIDAIFSLPFYLGVAGLSVLLGIVGGLLPALKGARMVPSNALRQE